MKTKITSIALLLGSFMFSQGIDTVNRDNAGASGAGIKSGFYQTANPINFPTGATDWWHLLDVRHDNPTNNFAMQFSGSFFDQNLYFRKTQNSSTTAWNKVVMENQAGNVGLGVASPTAKLDIDGNFKLSGDIITSGSNSWIFHTPDTNNRTALIIAPYVNGDWAWGTAFSFEKNGNAALQGKFEAKEIKVTLTPTADFVFEENYGLPKLKDVEKFIKENKHLPEVASAKVMEKEGVNVGEFQIKLLQKIEELTLYVIDQQKKIEVLENKLSDKK